MHTGGKISSACRCPALNCTVFLVAKIFYIAYNEAMPDLFRDPIILLALCLMGYLVPIYLEAK